MDWRELHLTRRTRAFNFAHRWLKVFAIGVGLPVTVISLMAVIGLYTSALGVRAKLLEVPDAGHKKEAIYGTMAVRGFEFTAEGLPKP